MIFHIDIDTFFVSAHRTLDISLNNRPVAVGGRSNLKIFDKNKVGIKLFDSNSGAFVNPVFYNDQKKDFNRFFLDKTGDGKDKVRGIVVTSSYEARAKGVKTGMPLAKALRFCPDIKILIPDYVLYHDLSHKLHIFLTTMFPEVEQFSIDEFFCDAGGWVKDDEVFSFAKRLKALIWQKFSLPVSIGISSAKWIAKLATKYAKPNGIYIVEKNQIYDFIENIPIDSFPGIGRGYKKRLSRYFITTLGEASRRRELFYNWKKPGIQLYRRIIGEDNEGISYKSGRKSIGISRTFDPICSRDEILRRVYILARHIVFIVFRHKVNPTGYFLKLSYESGARVKSALTVDRIFSETLCKNLFKNIFENIHNPNECVIKITLSVGGFSSNNLKTLSLIEFQKDHEHNTLTNVMQTLREKYSLDIIKNGIEI